MKIILLLTKRNVRRNISIQIYLSCFINHPPSFDMLQRTKTSRRNCAPTPLEIPICGPFDVWSDLIWTHTILWRGMENAKSNFLFCNRAISVSLILAVCPIIIFYILVFLFQFFQLSSEGFHFLKITFTFIGVCLPLS